MIFAYCIKLNKTLPLNPLYNGNPLSGTLVNSEDPDEMQHNAAFHQGLHCLLRLKQYFGTEIYHNLEILPENLKVHNGQSVTCLR